MLPDGERKWYGQGHCGPPERNLLTEIDRCPSSYAWSPAAIEAHRAFGWWERGELGLLYPHGVPRIIVDAVECVNQERTSWLEERARLLEKKHQG